jgi:predicted Rossmann-fold nucleotide-binding protein
MRVGIIGPTDIHKTALAAGRDPAASERAAREAGEGLATRGYDLVVVPDRGVGLLAAEAYRAAGGRRLIGIVPKGGTSGQAATCRCDEHRHLCDEVVDDLDWTEQHERICQLSAVLLCIGISCGTMSEIAWTKWVGNTPVVVIRPLISGIPPEVEAETDLRYVQDVEGVLRVLEEIVEGGEH